MNVKIGDEVRGHDAKLGEVHRVIVDARSNHVTDLVVKHGFLFGNERVVPLSCVTNVEDGVVHLDLDEKGFEAMNGYTDDRYRAPDPDYVGPPGFDNDEFMLDTLVAIGPGAGVGGTYATPPLGYPGGEQVSPDDLQRPVYAKGTPVLDAGGEKVGEIGHLEVDPASGAPRHITIRTGTLVHHEAEIPLDWIQELGDKGVQLSVTKADVERELEHAARR